MDLFGIPFILYFLKLSFGSKTAALYAICTKHVNCFSNVAQQNKCLPIATDLISFKRFKYLFNCSLTLF